MIDKDELRVIFEGGFPWARAMASLKKSIAAPVPRDPPPELPEAPPRGPAAPARPDKAAILRKLRSKTG